MPVQRGFDDPPFPGRRLGSPGFSACEFSAFAHVEPLLVALLRRQARRPIGAWRYVTARKERDEADGAVIDVTQDWLKDFHVTAREAEIAALILQGHSNISIGQALKISG